VAGEARNSEVAKAAGGGEDEEAEKEEEAEDVGRRRDRGWAGAAVGRPAGGRDPKRTTRRSMSF
jgi:hypothetical protein